MKIAQFDDSYFPILDGVAIAVHNYAIFLNKKGFETEVITVGHPEAKPIMDYQVLRSKYLHHPFDKMYMWPLPMIDLKLQKRLKKEKFDLIHLHSPFMIGHFGLRLGKKQKIPVVTTFHTKFYDDLIEATQSKILTKLTMQYIMRFFNRCDYVIAVSEHAKQTLQEYGYHGPVKVIPNGVDLTVPKNVGSLVKAVKAEFKIPSDEPVFVYVGVHNWKKNIRLIYEALALYQKAQSKFKLMMVGTGNHLKEIKQLGLDLGIDQNIIYTGRISDRARLTGIYLAADLMLFPSTYDTFSLVVREAARCYTPSVVVKNSGPAENIVHGINGFICDENATSLYQVIKDAVSDSAALKRVSKEAALTLPITWEAVVNEVADFYQEILVKKS